MIKTNSYSRCMWNYVWKGIFLSDIMTWSFYCVDEIYTTYMNIHFWKENTNFDNGQSKISNMYLIVVINILAS